MADSLTQTRNKSLEAHAQGLLSSRCRQSLFLATIHDGDNNPRPGFVNQIARFPQEMLVLCLRIRIQRWSKGLGGQRFPAVSFRYGEFE